MNILVINSGSSSIKAAVVNAESGQRETEIHVDRIADGRASWWVDGRETESWQCAGHLAALERVITSIGKKGDRVDSIAAVGHRVVHGGERFVEPARIDDEVLTAIRELTPLAPLHNPAAAAGIEAARRLLPRLPHVAVFDTAFHATLPQRARLYALPTDMARRCGIRRFGFHGTSHGFVADLAFDYLKTSPQDTRLVTCHLGNGCSVSAVEHGRSVETSMGMTPLEGLMMGSRCGDLDPGVLIHLLRNTSLDLEEVDDMLNHHSGLVGMTGTSDMQEIESRAAQGDNHCCTAIDLFTHRVRKYVGAYAAVMGGVEAIVFTGGIGENSLLVRDRISQGLGFLGAWLDEDRNRAVSVNRSRPVEEISTPESRTKLLVVATDEELAIAQQTALIIRRSMRPH